MNAMMKMFSVGLWLALTAFSGCGNREPFDLVPCSGKITYDDGTLISAEGNSIIVLTFLPQTPPPHGKVCPRPGVANVNLKDGTFAFVSSHKVGDGLTVGKHKVVISTDVRQNVPKGVPREYNNPDQTPLEVNTTRQPFLLTIHKPKS